MYSSKNGYHYFAQGTRILPTLFALAVLAFLWATPVLAEEKKSADEIAKELANPNASVAKLEFQNQFFWYTGDLPDADDQSNYTLLFQPVFPFTLEPTASGGKANLFFRPAIPFMVDQPVPASKNGAFDYEEVSALGDIVFDTMYGVTEKNGFLWALGGLGTLPTATDSDVAGGQFRFGPELLLAKFEKWGIIGIFPGHQWDVAGWNDDYYSATKSQFFLMALPGDGWSIGTKPTLFYDWKSEDWTIPLHFAVGKTVIFDKMPVKFEVEINYYVEQPDAFGPEWLVSFNITPVVDNFIENWIKGM
jgi:hypothetical protein